MQQTDSKQEKKQKKHVTNILSILFKTLQKFLIFDFVGIRGLKSEKRLQCSVLEKKMFGMFVLKACMK